MTWARLLPRVAAAALLLAVFGAPRARADTFGPTTPLADSYLESFNATVNYGSATVASVGTVFTSGLKERGILVWNIATIPEGSVVTNATFVLKTAAISGNCDTACDFRIRRVLRLITEAGVTWNTYNGSDAWTTGGCDGAGTDYSSTNIAGPFTAPTTVDATMTITSDATFTALVQDAVDLVFFRQARLLLVGDNEGSAVGYFNLYTKEHGTSSNRPTLEIDYIAPSTALYISRAAGAGGAEGQACVVAAQYATWRG